MPLISVIIPAHNRAVLLKRCLNSLVDQTFKDFEAIVVDDCSSEDIKTVVDHFSDRLNVIYIRNDNSMGGPARPRNIAIKASQGKWLAFLDNDDWWYPEKLEKAVPLMSKADIIYHELDVCDGNGRFMYRTSSRKLKSPVRIDLLVHSNALTNSSVVVKKELVIKAHGLDESRDLIAVEDYDLWLQIAKLTENFFFIDEALGGYYVGEGNISKSDEVQIKRLETVYHKHMHDLTTLENKNAKAALAYCKGYCYFQMQDYAKAMTEYLYTFKNISFFKMKLKSLARLMQIGARKCF